MAIPNPLWLASDEDEYWRALGALPPALRTGYGFLLGEPYNDRTCGVTGKTTTTFWAFREHSDQFHKSAAPMTVAEFRAWAPLAVGGDF